MLKTAAKQTATKLGRTRGWGQALPSPWALPNQMQIIEFIILIVIHNSNEKQNFV
jgi:hypothetical protein